MDNLYTIGGNQLLPGLGLPYSFINADNLGNYIVTTNGNIMVLGQGGDDILEDHGAQAMMLGYAGSDRLISRGGRDALWGGNVFGVSECISTDTDVDSEGNACLWYERFPEYCGNYDVADTFDAKTECCICGGGMTGGLVAVTFGSNNPTTFGADGEIENLGDQDTYVIYPTTEKSLDRPGFFVDTHATDNLKNRQGDCTKVYGLDKQDKLEFRLDDSTVETHKFADDD